MGANRHWIFFVIVAVGLIFSWARIGQKTHQVVVERGDVQVLLAESDCAPSRAPCAAMGVDRALVLGPAPKALLLRYTGPALGPGQQPEAYYLARDGRLLDAVSLQPGGRADTWLLDLPAAELAASHVRVRLGAQARPLVAEFPLY